MNNNHLLNKTLVLTIIMFFICSVFVPMISGMEKQKISMDAEFIDYIRYDDFEDYYVGEVPKSERGWSTSGNTSNQYIEARADPLDSNNMVMLIHGSSSDPKVYCRLHQENFGPAGSYVIHYRIYTPQLSMSKTIYENILENPYPSLVNIHRRTDQIRWGSDSYCGDYYEFNPPIFPSTTSWIEEEVRVTKNDLHLIHNISVDALGGYCNQPVEGINTWRIAGYREATQDFYIDDFWITTYSRPPNKPIINGSINGKPGKSYVYSFNSTDPDGHDLFLYIDWGDNTYEKWFGPFPSGVEIAKSHVFEYPGKYIIYAKVKDVYDCESDWSCLWITMPREKVIQSIPFLKLLQSFPKIFPTMQKLLLQQIGQ